MMNNTKTNKPKMRKTTMKKRFFQAMNRAKKGQHSEMYKWFFSERGRLLGETYGLYLTHNLWGWNVFYDVGSGRFEFRQSEVST
jgi:hypothetical protein